MRLVLAPQSDIIGASHLLILITEHPPIENMVSSAYPIPMGLLRAGATPWEALSMLCRQFGEIVTVGGRSAKMIVKETVAGVGDARGAIRAHAPDKSVVSLQSFVNVKGPGVVRVGLAFALNETRLLDALRVRTS
jgi:hypothetical protein